jgi:antitoxin component of MazEF toxin-antitoxin module
MVREARTTIRRVGSRHTLYLRKDLVEDSQFPFKPGEPLTVKIDGDRLIVERFSAASRVER